MTDAEEKVSEARRAHALARERVGEASRRYRREYRHESAGTLRLRLAMALPASPKNTEHLHHVAHSAMGNYYPLPEEPEND